MVNERLLNIQDWLFPGECLLCANRVRAGEFLCAGCLAALPRLIHACPRCSAACASGHGGATPCGACQRRPPAFDRARALYAYAPPVDWLIHGLKYRERLDLARLLGDQLAEFLAVEGAPRPDLLVPVPLHTSRLRTRGYNQSLELARYLARRLGIALDATGVKRIRATSPQTELPRDRRRANVRGAFAAGRNYQGRHIALVDDVMTSGHTVDELAKCLKKAGAAEVSVWVLARA